MYQHPHSRLRACALSALAILSSAFPGSVLADDVALQVSHRLINVIEFEDGSQGAEVEFTVANAGAVDLDDLRFTFGLNAPEPVPPEGEPLMRIERLAAGQTTILQWTLTGPGLIGEMVATSPLQGLAEAIHAGSLEIIAMPVISEAAGGAE